MSLTEMVAHSDTVVSLLFPCKQHSLENVLSVQLPHFYWLFNIPLCILYQHLFNQFSVAGSNAVAYLLLDHIVFFLSSPKDVY